MGTNKRACIIGRKNDAGWSYGGGDADVKIELQASDRNHLNMAVYEHVRF